MAERLRRVELTDSFLARLESIKAFLTEADAAFAYDDLLAGLRATVVPSLARFPLMGRRYLDQPPQSVEALQQLAQLPPGAQRYNVRRCRHFLHSEYRISTIYSLLCRYLLRSE